MIIDEQSVLSAYNDKCTLLQAINELNDNLKELGQSIISNDMIFITNEDPTTNEPYNSGDFKEMSVCFDYSTGKLYQFRHNVGTSTTHGTWNVIFVFASRE